MIPFSPPRIDELTIQEVVDTLKSGWITTGPKTKLFEQEISNYCGVAKTICLNSATAGMEMMLRLWGVGPGDEVIVPAYTYCATANVVKHVGATLVLADVKEDDFTIDVDHVAQLITEKTKVIIPVDFAGYPCDYDELNDLVRLPLIKKFFAGSNEFQNKLGRILILADAAHSFGSIYYGTTAGSFTDITVFSFHAVKNLTTAEGGAICFNLPDVFNLDELYQNINTLSLHGQNKDALAKTKKGNWEYDVVAPGFKCNMTDIQASIGLVELRRYEDNLSRRKEIFDAYTAAFEGLEYCVVPEFESVCKITSYHFYPLRLRVEDRALRDSVIQEIFNQDVSVNVHFKPIPLLTAYQQDFTIANYPVANKLFQQEISLPVYYDLTPQQVNQVIDAVKLAMDKILKA